MLRRLLEGLVWLGFASVGSRRRRGVGRDRFRGPRFIINGEVMTVDVERNSRGGRTGVSEVVGRLSAGSGGFLGEPPCRVCNGEPCVRL